MTRKPFSGNTAPLTRTLLPLLALLAFACAPTRQVTESAPLVIAHRGFSAIAPENTIVAYERAIDAGAELAECDVRLTADGVPVVIHDETLERTTGKKARVADTPLEEIVSLDAGRWKGSEFEDERVPTLVALLEAVVGRLRLVIEIKDRDMERQVVEALDRAAVDPVDVMIFSFDRETVADIARLEPLLPTTWLLGELPPTRAERREILRQALAARTSALGVSFENADPEFLRLAHESGFQVFVWTVNDPDDMLHLVKIRADAIITDRPDLALEVIHDHAEAVRK